MEGLEADRTRGGRHLNQHLFFAFTEAEIVLSWRGDSQPLTKLQRVFTGDGDALMLPFHFNNVKMRAKDLSERSLELFADVRGEAF